MTVFNKATVKVMCLLCNLQKQVVNDVIKSIIISVTYGRRNIKILGEQSIVDETFSFFRNFHGKWKILEYLEISFFFSANLVKKKNCLLHMKFTFTLIRIYRDVQIFSFRPEIPFLGIFGQKNQNCVFKLKFGA